MNAQRLKAAMAGLGLLAGVTFAPIVVDCAAPTVAAVASATVNPGAPPALQAGFAPAVKIGDYPLRRRGRRIHWSNWTHHVGAGGRFSWLVFGPIMAVVIAAVAVPLQFLSQNRRILGE